jgi:hypothetical protein
MIVYRYALSTYFIVGLTQYVPTGSSNIAATARTTTTNRKKNNNINNNAQGKDSVGLGDAENILVYKIPASQVANTHFSPILDSLVRSIFFFFKYRDDTIFCFNLKPCSIARISDYLS